MKDKIIKLLNSPVTDDVILAINLAVNHLSAEECKILFRSRHLENKHFKVAYWFKCNEEIGAFTGGLVTICKDSDPNVIEAIKDSMFSGELKLK